MSVLLVRLGVLTVAVPLAMLGLVGCSDGGEDSSLRRSQTPAPTRTPSSSKGTKSTDSAPSATPQPSSEPAPSPDGGATSPAPVPAPAPTPPAPGSCGAPKCFGLVGVGGCKATDSAGVLVTMGCQDGACECLADGQTTTTFDGDVNSVDDARSLFLVNCTCN